MENTLHWADYVIFVGFLLVSLSIGVFHALTGGRQKTTKEFIMADHKLRLWPTVMSLLVSFQSAIMILGNTTEVYTRGTFQWVGVSVGYVLALIVAERLFVPWLFPLKLMSVNAYFERRLDSKTVRLVAGVFGVTSQVLYMGVAIAAPSLALEAATGFPVNVSVVIMAAVCAAYTSLGGMKAVIWTDVFQFLVIFAGLMAIIIKGIIEVGSLSQVFELCDMEGRLVWMDVNPDPRVRHTIWGFIISWTLSWSNIYGLAQPSVQRYSSTKSIRTARLSLLLNLPLILIMVAISMLIGTVVFAYYAHTQCDPIEAGLVTQDNQILAHFVKTIFNKAPGFSGLFLATLYSGALSSVSSSLSGAAANTWEDALKWKLWHIGDFKATVINRCTVVLYGAVAAGIGILIVLMPGPITQISMTLNAATTGPILGAFLLAGVCRRATWVGTLVGILTGFSFILWISVGSFSVRSYDPPLPPVSTDGCTPLGNDTSPPITATGTSFTTDPALSTTVQDFSLLNGSKMGIDPTEDPSEASDTTVDEAITVEEVKICGFHPRQYIDFRITNPVTQQFSIARSTTIDPVQNINFRSVNPVIIVRCDRCGFLSDPLKRSGIEHLYALSYMWYMPLGTLISLLTGLIASLVIGVSPPVDIEKKYLIPWREFYNFSDLCRTKQTVEDNGLFKTAASNKYLTSNRQKEEEDVCTKL